MDSSDASTTQMKYEKLRELLEKETYPHVFVFKFVGVNSNKFLEGIHVLENAYPALEKGIRRVSKTLKHVSCTYTLTAMSADAILEVYTEIAKIPDLLLVL